MITTSKTALETAKAQLGVLLIDNVIKSAAIKQGVIPEAVDDVVLRAKGVYAIDEKGVPVPKGSDGKVIYGKDGTAPMSVEEWLASLKTTAKHLFQGARGSGAGGGDGGGGRGDTSKMTPAQKISAGLTNSANMPNQLSAT
jgi:hypothetical protein